MKVHEESAILPSSLQVEFIPNFTPACKSSSRRFDDSMATVRVLCSD